jgi:hypothetical protein
MEPSEVFAAMERQEALTKAAETAKNGATSLRMETDMLRRFFDCWEALHAIPNDGKHKAKSEQAAQLLVDTAHAIRAFRAGGG